MEEQTHDNRRTIPSHDRMYEYRVFAMACGVSTR